MSQTRISRGAGLQAASDGSGRPRSAPLLVVWLCWLVMFFDGFDLVMYGTVVPSLLDDEDWGLTPSGAGIIGGLALVGMIIGALGVGTLTDIIGRRWCAIGSMLVFSTMMMISAVSPSPEILGLTRLLAGIGLGGAMPTVGALILEYTRPARKNLVFTLMFTGYSVGGVVAALVAIPVIPAFGWRAMFVLGALPLVTLVPLAIKYLPESAAYLRSRGRDEEASRLTQRLNLHEETLAAAAEEAQQPRDGGTPAADLFRAGQLVRTLVLWAAMFCALLLIYGLTTWIPEVMRASGYPLGSGLWMLVAYNGGAAAGAVLAGRLADRFGSRTVLLVAFGAASIALVLLSLRLPLAANLALVAVAGVGSIGTANLMNVYVTSFYAVRSRATALGWTLGIGRIGAVLGPVIGGVLLGVGLDAAWNFYLFSAVAVLGAIAVALVPRAKEPVEPVGVVVH